MLDIGLPELILILVIALVIFGPGRIGGAGRAVGQALRDFRQALRRDDDQPPPR